MERGVEKRIWWGVGGESPPAKPPHGRSFRNVAGVLNKPLLFSNTELFQSILERAEAHAQQLGGTRDVPVGAVQGLRNFSLLVLFPSRFLDNGCDAAGPRGGWRRCRFKTQIFRRYFRRKVLKFHAIG